MRSFLKEIESKFQELQEKELDRDGDGDVDSDDYLMAKDKAIKAAMAKQKSNEMITTDDEQIAMDLDAKGKNVKLVKEDDIDEAHCNTKQEDVDEEVVTEDNISDLQDKRVDAVAKAIVKRFPSIKDDGMLRGTIRMALSDYIFNEDIDEISTSAGAGAYMTAKAFKDPDAPEKKYTYASVSEAMDQKYVQMIESYSRFATGNAKATPTQTVNGTIKEVAKKLQEIEKLVRYTSRLKNESGIAGSTYGKSTKNALGKISERLLKISERIRSLGE